MKTLHRMYLAFSIVATSALMTVLGSGGANAQPAAPPGAPSGQLSASVQASTAASSCWSVRQLGTKKVVRDKGMDAFTVRQYIGWCSDASGSAWMNYASVYVWDQYHYRGFSYRAQVGIVVRGDSEVRGYVVGANRAQLTYSTPVRTTRYCTQGWGKLARDGGESAQGLSSLVC